MKVAPSRAPVLILCSPQKPARISRTTDTEHQQSTIVKRPQASDITGPTSTWRHRPTSANHGLFRPPEAHAQAEFVGPSQQDPRPLTTTIYPKPILITQRYPTHIPLYGRSFRPGQHCSTASRQISGLGFESLAAQKSLKYCGKVRHPSAPRR